MHSVLEAPSKAREYRMSARRESATHGVVRDQYRMIFDVPSLASPKAAGFMIFYQGQTSVTKQEIEDSQRQLFAEKCYRANVWRSRLLTRNGPDDVDAISETVESVIDALTWFGPRSVSFDDFDVSYANASHLVAVLRTTFNWRREVPGWSNALRAAHQVLADQGLNPEDELFGLEA